MRHSAASGETIPGTRSRNWLHSDGDAQARISHSGRTTVAASYSNTVHGDLRHEGERRPRQFSMRSMKGGQTVKWIGIFPPFIRRVAVNLKIWRLTPGG